MSRLEESSVSDELSLGYHLMHPGGESAPGDPNVAFCLEGTYHLHYILRHQWDGDADRAKETDQSYSFIHVTSPDMVHWSWQPTKLQPSFTGHGMFSGTGFMTKEGKPAAIYAGVSTPRQSYVAIAKDTRLGGWEKPYAVMPRGGPDGNNMSLRGDPDCFLIGDTYYAYSAVEGVLLCKSDDLKTWDYVGPFFSHSMPDVAVGEDVSCANFFQLGNKWFLLCISHQMGCRYYIGEWDEDAEQFVPESHGRMNWRRRDQSLIDPGYRDFFAPESVRTPDGRRVMWAWIATSHPMIDERTVQSLPRELSLDANNTLKIDPLRDLESLRFEPRVISDVFLSRADQTDEFVNVDSLDGDAFELRISVDRTEAEGKRFGFRLFAGGAGEGLAVLFRPESSTISVGETEAPFAVSELPLGEGIDLRVFIDKYLVEVFVNGRQALLSTHMAYKDGNGFEAYLFGSKVQSSTLRIRKIEIWRLKSANQGFLEAKESRIWAPETA